MKRGYRWAPLVVILLLLAVLFVIGYLRGSFIPLPLKVTFIPKPPLSASSPSAEVVKYRMETFVSGLSVPWSLVFTSPDRLLVAERPGSIRIILNGRLISQPLIHFPETISRAEDGLMGMTLHPKYKDNKWIYVSLDYHSGNDTYVKIVRIIDQGDTAVLDKVILDKIPASSLHTGSRIKFGPDGLLYITTGDSTKKELAQDMNSLAGKILRITDEGGVPSDNPFPNSLIYSYGHRNPQGIDWDPLTGALFSVEHGPSGFDGPGGGDELNHITKGSGFGWPLVSHDRSTPGQVSPLIVWTPAIAPASANFYTGKAFPQFKNDLFIGGLIGEGLYHVTFDHSSMTVVSWEKLPDIKVGRIRDVITGPDGFIYFSTSNTDGRGRPRSGDDKILRLVPN